MEQLIIWMMATAGMSYGVVKMDLFKALREGATNKYLRGNKALWFFHHVLNCTFCFGFHAGVLLYYPVVVMELDIVALPFIGSAVSRVFDLVIEKLK
jgi:hypothetical protein